jgi:hypothetical protein
MSLTYYQQSEQCLTIESTSPLTSGLKSSLMLDLAAKRTLTNALILFSIPGTPPRAASLGLFAIVSST